MKCFYHSADLDGHCSGALVKMAYPNCELAGINYGDSFPWESIENKEKIFMVDFSLQPFDGMIELSKKSSLIWIDHHKSAIEDLDKWGGTVPGFQRSGLGACALVWEYLKDSFAESIDAPMPTFIKLLAEYDVWDHSDPRTLAFQYGIRQYETGPEKQDFWRELFDVERVQQIVEEGGLLLRYEAEQNKKYADACSFETELDGLRCIAINKMLTNSKIFDSVWNPEKYDAMLTFGFRKGQWTVSLYSDKPEIDVSVVAKNRGGGGHKGAAGFQTKDIVNLLSL